LSICCGYTEGFDRRMIMKKREKPVLSADLADGTTGYECSRRLRS
jgi:hypothetical protein